ncbi:unnamed protein product [Ilex paraguariensis]|uniref:Uncharacterized protein n=1 Tax=Ilex paraguariensis TaxID=185542 RepID=A0ABC8R0G2_9AQUA
MKNKQVGDHSNCPKPPIMVHSSSCPKSVDPSHPKQNKNVDHSSSLPNLVSSSIPVKNFFNRISEEVYHNRFCHRPVLLERGAQLDKMTNLDCAVIFGLRHWNSIVEIDMNDRAYDGLVRIFYANMHDVEKEELKFKSYMRNVHFEVNLDLISKILNVPSPFIVENIVTYPFKNLGDQPTLEDVATELYDDYDTGASTSGDIVQMLKQILVNQEELQQEMKESLEQICEDTKKSLKQLRDDTKESLR